MAAAAAAVVNVRRRQSQQQDIAIATQRFLEEEALQREYDNAPMLLITVDLQTALIEASHVGRDLQVRLSVGADVKILSKVAGTAQRSRFQSAYRKTVRSLLGRSQSDPGLAKPIDSSSTASWTTSPDHAVRPSSLRDATRLDFRSTTSFVFTGEKKLVFELVEQRTWLPDRVVASARLSMNDLKAALGTALTRSTAPVLHDLKLCSNLQELIGELQAVVRCQKTTVGEARRMGILPLHLQMLQT
mmetsp:Transcript_84504/g.149577  ORF Transcript_84504/g.149577 Transcript_84504/m.149577 type:complete len:245 (-) Transcript_84504:149-883(-)